MLHVSGRKLRFLALPLAFLLYLTASTTAFAQASAFTYQGRLTDNGNPATGVYDFELRLFDAVEGGTQKGTTLTRTGVEVTNGTFSVQLEFAGCLDCFDGGARFLEISVRPAGAGSYTLLTPRQQVTSTPYAIKAMDATRLGGQLASDFIQNTTTEQMTTNFNIGGSGTVAGTLTGGVVNAATQYQIGGLRMLAANGPYNDGVTILTASNTFLGDSAGINTTPGATVSDPTGKFNSFFGAGAGKANSIGFFNSFFGTEAGFSNINGDANAFFGASAGRSNTSGRSNAFFGWGAGRSNTTGEFNSFFGRSAGFSNTTGDNNAIFGAEAGVANTEGRFNAIFGARAGFSNTGGMGNSFFGTFAGFSNTTGDKNTIIGSEANVGAVELTNATAIGANAQVSQNNSLILGSINGVNFATADTLVGIGTTVPAARLHVSGTGIIRARVNSNDNAGLALTLDNQPKWSVATVVGGQFQIFNDATGQNALWIDSATNNVGVGTTSTADKLTVAGTISFSTLGSAGGAQLCRNGSNQISQCSSSSRYKSNIAALDRGFELIDQLRPVTFDWKQGGGHDLGLVAEEVAKVEPLLVTRNERGEIEGVKYDRVGVVLINAVKEQQAQLENQQRTIERQQEQLERQKAENDKLKQQLKQQEERLQRLEAAIDAMPEGKKN